MVIPITISILVLGISKLYSISVKYLTNILPIREIKMRKLIENTNSQNTMRFAFIFPKTQELSKGVVEFGTFDIETYSKSGNNKFIPYCAVAYFSSAIFQVS